ncbi:hypothetical protein KYK31_01045 [Hymenobacter norwichensis]|nr:hypothetical protein [Hymenobacter norwichensis]
MKKSEWELGKAEREFSHRKNAVKASKGTQSALSADKPAGAFVRSFGGLLQLCRVLSGSACFAPLP